MLGHGLRADAVGECFSAPLEVVEQLLPQLDPVVPGVIAVDHAPVPIGRGMEKVVAVLKVVIAFHPDAFDVGLAVEFGLHQDLAAGGLDGCCVLEIEEAITEGLPFGKGDLDFNDEILCGPGEMTGADGQNVLAELLRWSNEWRPGFVTIEEADLTTSPG